MLKLGVDPSVPPAVQQIFREEGLLRRYGIQVAVRPSLVLSGVRGRPATTSPVIVLSDSCEPALTDGERCWWNSDVFLSLLRPCPAGGVPGAFSCVLGLPGTPGDVVWIASENLAGRVPVLSAPPPPTWPALLLGVHYTLEPADVSPAAARTSIASVTSEVLLRRLLRCLPQEFVTAP